MSSLLDEKAVNDFNKKNHDEIEQDKKYWAIKKGVKRRQTAIDQLTKDTYLIKSLRGKQYTAFLSKDLEDVIIKCPCKVDIVFYGRNAYIVNYFPSDELYLDGNKVSQEEIDNFELRYGRKPTSYQELVDLAKDEDLELGGDY